MSTYDRIPAVRPLHQSPALIAAGAGIRGIPVSRCPLAHRATSMARKMTSADRPALMSAEATQLHRTSTDIANDIREDTPIVAPVVNGPPVAGRRDAPETRSSSAFVDPQILMSPGEKKIAFQPCQWGGVHSAQLLVEEQPHGSSSRNTERAAFALGRVRQTGLDVVARDLRKLRQHLILRHTASQVSENVAHRDSGSTDAWLAEPDGRIDADAVKTAHRLTVYLQGQQGTNALEPTIELIALTGRRRMGIIKFNPNVMRCPCSTWPTTFAR